ncbi:phage P1-related protein [Amedibacillus dolichus CAG:375]|uniref:Phage P1-related protein n=1 Tax=Amedibacillus dolichus CAG:375 TaxID=1263076 RepID=R7G7U3_9FIRM|nr:hypothetical protein [Amedibacillus dolichus]CDE23026.1 phage P1-related protein [Amedibacillus dolichus CAG:375]
MEKITNCEWLPMTISLNDYGGDFEKYFDYLYDVFKRDLLHNQPLYKGLRVGARKYPLVDNKHEGFYHLTHRDYEKTGFSCRQFDTRRSERLHWIKPVIENYGCTKNCCSRIKVWTEKKRVHILFEDERYVVVLDNRKTYYVVVTAYYIDQTHTLNKLLKRYNYYK